MNKRRVESVVAAAIFAALGWSTVAADQALAQASSEAKTEYWLMDHSPADPKGMLRMSKPGSQTAQPQAKVEYSTMNHSPADAKSMVRMDKNPQTKTPQGKTDYLLMDHSRGDVKAMRGMKGPEKVVTVGE